MADSLVLTGKRTVTKHTGTEMTRLDDKRGGNTWQLPRWWVRGGNGVVYVASTVFKVSAGGATGYLAIANTSESVNIKIVHDGSFNFDFQFMNEVSRGALFDADMKLVEHYVFPKISGGKTMVVTPPDAAARPDAGGPPPAADTTINTVTVSGDETPTVGDTSTYTVAVDGDATPFTYTWGVPVGESVATGQGTDTITVNWGADGNGAVTCLVSSTNGDFDGNDVSDTLNVTVAAAPTPDVVVTIDSTNGSDGYILSGDAVGENATINVTAGDLLSITNNTGGHPLYIKSALGSGNSGQINDGSVTGQGATNGEILWDTDGVAPGTYYYQCQLHEPMNGEIVVA